MTNASKKYNRHFKDVRNKSMKIRLSKSVLPRVEVHRIHHYNDFSVRSILYTLYCLKEKQDENENVLLNRRIVQKHFTHPL